MYIALNRGLHILYFDHSALADVLNEVYSGESKKDTYTYFEADGKGT